LNSYSSSIRKLAFFSGLILLFLTVASFGLASQKFYYTQQINEAVLFAPTITVKSSPTETSVDLFVLHEGSKVTLLDKTTGWQKIKIANGSVGWLPEGVLKGI
ncbi:MAG: SH3 domain-containing protein, partial [Ignavibacteria bacterium]|nr:SH3 domain-containing protein [Ignavibacteria bacterium]